MASEWQETTLGDLIDIKHGFAFKGHFIHDEPDGDVLLTPGNFAIGGGFKGDKCKYYDGLVPEEFVLQEGDFLVTMTDLSKQSDTLGFPAFVPVAIDGRRYLHNQRIGKISLKNIASTDARFIHYVMCSAKYRHEVLASATGTTVKHTSPNRIKRFRFHIPELAEQRAIAHILGTLDDKIELNRQMNQTLEEMARALFKSWFVDFDPVRAKATLKQRDATPSQGGSDWSVERARAYLDRMDSNIAALFPDSFVDSELGPIPEGWEVGAVGKIAGQRRCGVHPQHIDPSTPYIALEHMPRRCIALSEWDTADGLASSKFRFEERDILFGKLRPYFHKIGVAPLRGVCSTDIVVISPVSDAWFGFVLGHASSSEFVDYTDATSTGTKMPRTKWADMSRYQIPLPSQELAEGFNKSIQPAIDRIVSSIHESRTLATLRDTLLPKLMSGEIRIEDIAPLEAVSLLAR